ncbi:MAG: hypothetical protein L7T80_00715, partial [Arenicellales bacterium]|nr:hypothetical protein [Arenicellales bacterium]
MVHAAIPLFLIGGDSDQIVAFAGDDFTGTYISLSYSLAGDKNKPIDVWCIGIRSAKPDIRLFGMWPIDEDIELFPDLRSIPIERNFLL